MSFAGPLRQKQNASDDEGCEDEGCEYGRGIKVAQRKTPARQRLVKQIAYRRT